MAKAVKNLPQCKRHRFDPWVRKIPWRREWQPTPVFWPGESCGQRSLVGSSPWGRKESDMNERLTPRLNSLLVNSKHESWNLKHRKRKTCSPNGRLLKLTLKQRNLSVGR